MFEPDYSLSNSFLLGWTRGNDLVLDVDFALTESHPRHQEPPDDHWACFIRGTLTFPNVRSIEGLPETTEAVSSTDATGERDYGDIDALDRFGDSYVLEGDFGQAVILSDTPFILLADDTF